jgi:hypothetical protein
MFTVLTLIGVLTAPLPSPLFRLPSPVLPLPSPLSPLPGAMSGHRMAYDPVARRVLLYSGVEPSPQGNRYRSRLWAYDGKDWTFLAADGPSGRDDVQLAFDSRRGRLVLYGGRRIGATRADLTLLTDTWEWDGSAWHQVDSAGTGPRMHSGMAYDSARGVMVLFGGFGGDQALRADTWEWNGVKWSRRADGPADRWINGVVYDPRHGGILLHAAPRESYDDKTSYARGELWRWDGSTWARVDSAPPVSPQEPIVATDTGLLFFDGWNPEHRVNAWNWDGVAWKRIEGVLPPPRRNAALVYDSARRVVLLYSGETDRELLDDLWEFDGNKWTRRN